MNSYINNSYVMCLFLCLQNGTVTILLSHDNVYKIIHASIKIIKMMKKDSGLVSIID